MDRDTALKEVVHICQKYQAVKIVNRGARSDGLSIICFGVPKLETRAQMLSQLCSIDTKVDIVFADDIDGATLRAWELQGSVL